MVLDTSIFTNPDVRGGFGDSPTAALRAFLDLARRIRAIEFFMPPSIWDELGNFLDRAAVPGDAELLLQRKAPNKFELTVPAFLLYELIDDVRRRVDKGLRLAEDAARAPRPGGHEEEQERIHGLRRKYREALREGIIDSTEDVELILLAKELGAIVVSADRGVLLWAEKLGLRWIEPASLKGVLTSQVEPGC
jgi:RNA ligase partner protein